jgi:CheY-like chemotaxis protein
VRVLIIEDNRDAADSLRLLLEMLGHDVRAAYTGPEGVEAASAWRPDAVISDIGLPGLNGYEVARRLRTMQVRFLHTGQKLQKNAKINRLGHMERKAGGTSLFLVAIGSVP